MTQDARAQILAAATDLIMRKGFAGTSMNDIVQASGLSKGGVYWHFSSKDEIITAIFEQFFELQLAGMKVFLDDDSLSATDKLMRLVDITGYQVDEFTAQFPPALEFYALAARTDTLRERLTVYLRQYQDYVVNVVEQGIAAQEWKPVDPVATAQTIIALFEGAFLLWGVLPDQFHMENLIQTSVNLLLEGLKVTP